MVARKLSCLMFLPRRPGWIWQRNHVRTKKYQSDLRPAVKISLFFSPRRPRREPLAKIASVSKVVPFVFARLENQRGCILCRGFNCAPNISVGASEQHNPKQTPCPMKRAGPRNSILQKEHIAKWEWGRNQNTPKTLMIYGHIPTPQEQQTRKTNVHARRKKKWEHRNISKLFTLGRAKNQV